MLNRAAQHLPAIAMSLVVTLSLLIGIDSLAVQEHAASDATTVATQLVAPRG
jgi:hypothetical protein